MVLRRPNQPTPAHTAGARIVVLRSARTMAELVRGHPWLWRESIAKGLDEVNAGDQVQVVAPDGAPVGRGIADPGSPIAVRMWTTGQAPIDDALWQARSERACLLRRHLFEGAETDAYRVVNGEGDRMPGFVVDRYGSVAIVRVDGEAAAARLAEFARAIGPGLETLGVRTVVHRSGARGEPPRLDTLRGPPPPDMIVVRERGVPFVVDLARGQKTGAFLDQRDNRARVGELARGRRVLNLFSYAGGFSVHAARGGATQVTSVDVAAAAHATAQASFRAAGVDANLHAFATADVRAFLDAASARGERWDLVISDPPSFAPSEKARPRALAAYRALHAACAKVLAPGGILCAASCSSHVDAEAFVATLGDDVLGDGGLSLLELRGAGADHPTLAAFPEGRYLKFAVLA
jgi:23S rRNA (cytosine1962-C5)-methyltransferase